MSDQPDRPWDEPGDSGTTPAAAPVTPAPPPLPDPEISVEPPSASAGPVWREWTPGAATPPPPPDSEISVEPPSASAGPAWGEATPGAVTPSGRTDAVVAVAATVATAHIIRDEIFAWFKTLFSAAVYATLIVTFVCQVARVEGQSMAPTLADQDRLIVNKLAYRIGSPRRGDIVMLYYPKDPDKSFVKRVIAEEGDTVKLVDGRVYVNDVPMPDDFVPPEYRSHDNQPAQVIPPGYYFVMGDHRNNSSDSRHWGEVPKRYIIGRVQLRWWPIPHARLF